MLVLALNISKLPIAEFIEACRRIVTMMTGNANFTTPNPPLTDITTALDALETTYQEGLSGDHAAKNLQYEQLTDATELMMQLKLYVQTTSGDDVDVALSSGMSLRRPNQSHNDLNAPQNVRATTAVSTPGRVDLLWNGVPHRRSYQVYATTNLADVLNPANWTQLATVSVPRFTATDLTSGSKYAFIVVATGVRNILSDPSDPAIATVM